MSGGRAPRGPAAWAFMGTRHLLYRAPGARRSRLKQLVINMFFILGRVFRETIGRLLCRHHAARRSWLGAERPAAIDQLKPPGRHAAECQPRWRAGRRTTAVLAARTRVRLRECLQRPTVDDAPTSKRATGAQRMGSRPSPTPAAAPPPFAGSRRRRPEGELVPLRYWSLHLKLGRRYDAR